MEKLTAAQKRQLAIVRSYGSVRDDSSRGRTTMMGVKITTLTKPVLDALVRMELLTATKSTESRYRRRFGVMSEGECVITIFTYKEQR